MKLPRIDLASRRLADNRTFLAYMTARTATFTRNCRPKPVGLYQHHAR
ncbi:hypothetical protein [Aurantiacibacter zhengii]|nr:hypothetical protein [Aurantiacibacter zhengii]